MALCPNKVFHGSIPGPNQPGHLAGKTVWGGQTYGMTQRPNHASFPTVIWAKM